MKRVFKNIGVVMIKIDHAYNRFIQKTRHFLKTYLYVIFFVIVFGVFTFVEITYLSDDAYGFTDRIISTILYLIFLVVTVTALYFFFNRKQVKNIDGTWEVVDYEEKKDNAVPKGDQKEDNDVIIKKPEQIKLKLRPQGHQGKEGIGQKDMVNYLNDYYNHQYKNEIRYFVYSNFEPEKKQQRLRKINGSFEAPPVDDKTSFIELFWVLCQEEIITSSFSKVSVFLKTVYPWFGDSIEKMPSENKFSEHYRNTPNIRTFLQRIRRKP